MTDAELNETGCPFCRLQEDGSEEILARTEHCYMIGYREAHLMGMMIIPFRHVESAFELSSNEWIDHQTLVLRAKEMLAVENPDGYNLGWNIGRVGGQSVPHAHLHVMARFGDEPFAGKGIRHWIKSAQNRRASD